jgi:heavy metal translocating P-type ATPase
VSRTNAALDVCAYCGLPAPRAWWGSDAVPGPSYCCYGCRFAANVSTAEGDHPEARWMFTRLALAIFCTMNVMAFTMALWSGDVYGGEDSMPIQSLQGIFRYLSMFFAIPVFYSLGLPLLENAWDSLKRGIANIDVLLVAGVAASFVVSVYSVFRDDGPVYFEVGCMVLVLVTLGRWLEATGKARASQSLEALEKLLPEKVAAIQGEREEEKLLRDVAIHDRLRVRAGERIPCDGVLLGPSAHLDEQLLTGESAVRTKEPGDRLFAGTLNLDCDLIYDVTSAPDDGALARLVRMVRQAQLAKGRFEQTADRLARWFLPLVVAVALGTTAYHGLTQGWPTGVLAGLSVVLIACPCALGIATPLAMWTAIGQAARQRVLLQGGEVLERLARVQHLCFDKTGTLTTGTPLVQHVYFAPSADEASLRRWTATLTSASRHVHSRAIAAFLGQTGDLDATVQTLPGRGLRADGPIYLGSLRWMAELGMSMPDELAQILRRIEAERHAVVCLASSSCVQALFVLVEEWRTELNEVMSELTKANLGLTILSGDPNLRPLPWEARGGLLPDEKLHFLEDLRRQGKVVAMVGDGINDSPALAASDIGIAMGCGADVARDAAGVCLLDNDLRKIPWTIALAKKTVRVMRQNLAWAFAFNLVGIAFASLGMLNPVLAALAMTLSSLLVLANSLRLGTTPSTEAPP